MAANYNCLLFDLDGTLFDFSAAERAAIGETLAEAGIADSDEAAAAYSKINAELWAQLERGEIKKDRLVVRRFQDLLDALGEKGDPIRMNNCYMTRLSAEATPFPGAQELLAELAEFATLAAVTNGIDKIVMSRLQKSGLGPYFDDVFVSEKIGCAKPSPKIFEHALKKLGIAHREKVLVIGDSLSADIAGGAAAGLATCWCNFTGAENQTKFTPTYTVADYAQLKLVAVGEEELKIAAAREKRHQV